MDFLIKLIFVISLIGSSTASVACRPRHVELSERIEDASSIYVGYVTAIKIADYEADLVAGVDPERISIPQNEEFRVFVTETLIGSPVQFIEAYDGSGCGTDTATFREQVLVFVDQGNSTAYVLRSKKILKDVKLLIDAKAGNLVEE